MLGSEENAVNEAATRDLTLVVDTDQPQPHWDDQEDLRAIIQNLSAEVKELKALVRGIEEKKEISDCAVAVYDADSKRVLQELPKHILRNHDKILPAEGVADIESKNQPVKHQVPTKPKQPGTELVPNPRISYRSSKPNSSGTRVVTDGKPPDPQNISDSDADIAFEAKDIRNKDDKITSYEITLKSKGLRSVIWNVIGDWLVHEKTTNQKSWVDNDQVWSSSFLFVMHYWTDFEAEAKDDRFKNDQPHQDLQELLRFIETVQPEKVHYRRKLETLEKIPYDCLWMLFRPGSLIVTRCDVEQIYHQVLQVHTHRSTSESGEKEMVVFAWAFDWNGSELVRRYFEFSLGKHPHTDESRIRDLPCWPIWYFYHDIISESGGRSESIMRDMLMKRGRDMREHCVLKSGRNRMCNFQGVVQIWEREPEPEDRLFLRFNNQTETKRTTRKITNKPIMVDFEAYREFHSAFQGFGGLKAKLLTPCKCSYCVSPGRKKWIEAFNDPQKKNEELFGEDETDSWMLLPYRLLGYAIQGGFWAQFPVEGITKYIHQDQGAYGKVLFPEDKEHQKTTLRNLVMSHLSETDGEKPDGYWVSDFIQGKGQGLVVLLHGASGLGKTSTAESLAKEAQRPLLKISASGIGSTAKAAEENLMKYFRLATSWEAIILLDEADVFLETRGTPGEKVFERNALVAVMLRILEYFDGVLFLTTNRVLKLDIAMLSRIHYAIHFTDLTKGQETGIWNEQLRQLDAKKGNVTSTEKIKIQKWVETYQKKQRGARYNNRIGLNGREIHNVFKTAQHIANGDGGRKITVDDLEEAIEAIQNFRSEMRDRVEKAERLLVVGDAQPDS